MAKVHMVQRTAPAHLSVEYESLSSLAEEIQRLRDQYGDDAYLETEERWGDRKLVVVYKDPETAEEASKRLEMEKRHREEQRQRDLEQLARLKDLYEQGEDT